MKTLKEIYSGNSGIAAIFAVQFATDYNNFFGENTAATVDAYILFKYGNKYLADGINDENAATIVCSVIQMRLQVWRKMYAALTAQYNAAQKANETRTKTGTLQRSVNSTTTATNAAKAFNDTEFTTDTQNTDVNSGLNTDSYNLTETVTNFGGNTADRVQSEITLRQRNNLQLAIIIAILNEITLSIY